MICNRLDPRTSLVDAAVMGWLICTSLVLVTAPTPPNLLRVAAHAVVIVLIWFARGCLIAAPPMRLTLMRCLHACYPFLLLPFMYKELDVLSPIAAGRMFDGPVQQWELWLFGPSPATWLSEALPSPALSEILHFCYISFYAMLPILALSLLWRKQPRAFQALLWTGFGTFFLSYLVAIVFPVQGPRPIYPPIAPSLQGFFWSISHALCAKGAAGGAAFPSGHVAVSMVTALCAWRWNRRVFPIFALWAFGIAAATVYGRYHYAVDVLAGMALAALMAWLGPASFAWICPDASPAERRPGPPSEERSTQGAA